MKKEVRRRSAGEAGREFFLGNNRPYMLAIVAAIIVFILVAPARVHGDNMSPLLNDGDIIIMHKGSYYDARLPAYGDVLYFKRSFAPESVLAEAGDERMYRIARVYGLPGDKIELRDGKLFRNGGEVGEYAASGGAGEAAERGGAVEVGPGEVFVMADGAADVVDSRSAGVATKLGDVRGRVLFRVWPLNGFGLVR
jgi:signal peptidase I